MADAAALVNGHRTPSQASVSDDHPDSVASIQQGLEDTSLASTDESQSARVDEAEEVGEEGTGVYEVESLCMNCHGDGVTKLLLLKIPFFREVILESFECPHCGHKNSTVKSADQIQEKGTKFTLKLTENIDLERQIIKSDAAIFKVEDLGLEMPTGAGQITNVEGLLIHILQDMESGQPARRRQEPALAARIQEVIDKLIRMMNGVAFPFRISLNDPTGNSWIARSTEDTTHKYFQEDYFRTPEQNEALGLGIEDEPEPEEQEPSAEEQDPLSDVNILSGQVYAIPAVCPACSRPCIVNSQMLDIPHFKEVIVMATVCDHCGYKTNEVKTGGAIPDKGQRITLTVMTMADLSRDILKSQHCAIECAELNLSVQPGTMGGRFTTVEGLLTQVRDDLHGKMFGMGDEDLKPGDSMASEEREKWVVFFANLDKALKAEMEFTLILEDPLASSYVQSLGDENGEGEVDAQLKVEDYERSAEEEEELGLTDMKTEGYEADHEAEVKAREAAEAETNAHEAGTTTEGQS